LFKICPCCYNSHKEEDIEDIAQALELKKKKRDDDDDDEDNSDSEDDQTADGDITRLHCNQCPVETCSKSSIKNTFSKCDRCSIGNYTVHISTTYHAYLVCNSPSCLSVYHLSSRTKRAHIVASSSCDSCGRALLRVISLTANILAGDNEEQPLPLRPRLRGVLILRERHREGRILRRELLR